MQNIEVEVWKPVIGWENLYEVSNLGRIRSFDRIVATGPGKRGKKFKKGQVLRTFSMSKKKPYLRVTLCFPGMTASTSVHRVVAEAFIPNPDNKPQVNHIDGNPFNNHISNLEWITALRNTQHAHETGLANSRIDHNGNAKLTSSDIIEIRRKHAAGGVTFNQLGREYGISGTHIGRIVKRQVSKYL